MTDIDDNAGREAYRQHVASLPDSEKFTWEKAGPDVQRQWIEIAAQRAKNAEAT